jgi:hypothetical protein
MPLLFAGASLKITGSTTVLDDERPESMASHPLVDHLDSHIQLLL